MNDFLRISGDAPPPNRPGPKGYLRASREESSAAAPPSLEDTASLSFEERKAVREEATPEPPRRGDSHIKQPAAEKSGRAEAPAAFIFQEEFPEMTFGLSGETSRLFRPAAGSIIDGLWDRWCDSLNLGHALKRVLVKTLKDVDRISGNHVSEGKQKIKNFSERMDEYQKTCERSLSNIQSAAKKLSKSSDAALKEIGMSALRTAKKIQNPVEHLREPVKDLTHSADDGYKTIRRGAELIKSGISHIPAGGDKPLSNLHEGRAILKQGLAANLKYGKEHVPEIQKSLKDVSSAADGSLAASSKKHRNLSKEKKALLLTLADSTREIAWGAARLEKMTTSLLDFFSKEPAGVASSIDQSLNNAWNRIARDPDNVPLEFTCVHRSTKDFIIYTNDFRAELGAAGKGDARAAERLRETWGYTPESVPPEGTCFIDPAYFPEDIQKGRLSASQFPSGKPVDAPPSLEDQLFGGGRAFTLKDDAGREFSIGSLEDYRIFIASSRKSAFGKDDVPAEPRQIHLALRGGGGLGNRYPPAVIELYRLGIIPSSLSGTSAGSIAASVLAAGADPAFLETIIRDERLSKLYDVKLGGGGLLKGEIAYKFVDDILRNLTGIKDRPVTFADLKIPLHILAIKFADSAPPPGHEDLGQWENRMFVFGPETTPNTPVALAVRASIAIPGVFEPVEMVDPTTGRTVLLADGGVLDNLPIGYNRDDLPTVAFNLGKQNRNHPDDILNNLPTRSIPKEQLYAGNPILNALYSGLLYAFSGRNDRDYAERFNPPPETFVFNIPTWNIEKPSEGDSELSFAYDPKIDPVLDVQTSEHTRKFFRTFFDDLTVPGSCGTNLKPLPEKPGFERTLEYNGSEWKACFDGKGHNVILKDEGGKEYTLKIGKKNLESWLLDDSAYGDLNGRLIEAMSARRLKGTENNASSKANK
ncbi:MAG: patatin-like phospholipase family protein [bacterium]